MFTTQTRRIAQTEQAALTDELDRLDNDFTNWAWTQVMTEPVAEDVKWEDCLDVDWAEALGII